MAKLIVIDGLDGSGKGTHTQLLCDYLRECCLNVLKISFPDYGQPSSSLVKMYLSGEFGTEPAAVNPYIASSFYAVDRAASFLKFWKNEYENKDTVIIADRYTTSNIIHQTVKLPREQWKAFIEWTQEYEYGLLNLPAPDLVLYLDMPVNVSRELITSRYGGDDSKKDIHESDLEYLCKCRETALYAAKLLDWSVVSLSDGANAFSIEENQRKLRGFISDLGWI